MREHKTPGKTRCRLRDAGDVQLDAGVKVEPEAAAREASSLSGIYLRVPTG